METQNNLWVNETYIDDSAHVMIGESEPYETFTDNLSRLYKSLRREYGGIVRNQYVDLKDGSTRKTGWVFTKRVKYEDAPGNDPTKDYYMRSVWVTVYKSKPVKRVTFDVEYADF